MGSTRDGVDGDGISGATRPGGPGGSATDPDATASEDVEPAEQDLAQPQPQPSEPESSGRRSGPVRRWFRRQPRWRRRGIVGALAVVSAFALLVGSLATALFVEGTGTPAATARSTGHDALWLGHAWVGWPADAGKTAKTDADLAALEAQIRDSGIRDLFVHAGPFDFDGTLDPVKSPRAEWFLAAIHRDLPGIRVQAWLGQVVGGSALDLGSAATRRNIVAGVAAALDRGYDGVHFDFEPVEDGDHGFLELLADSRQQTASRGARLSVSVPTVEPLPGVQGPGNFLAGHAKWWSKGYLTAVARRSDQVAIMAYDTGMPTEWAYRGYLVRQVEAARSAVPSEVGLLIGVPAFHADEPGHDDGAETMAAAVRGVRLGLGSGDPGREFGVAIYVDFAATPGDWQAYRRGWLRPGG